jgi:hypothetical protein
MCERDEGYMRVRGTHIDRRGHGRGMRDSVSVLVHALELELLRLALGDGTFPRIGDIAKVLLCTAERLGLVHEKVASSDGNAANDNGELDRQP